MSDATLKEYAIATDDMLRALSEALQQPPERRYTRRVCYFSVYDEDDCGGEPAIEYEISLDDLTLLRAALRPHG